MFVCGVKDYGMIAERNELVGFNFKINPDQKEQETYWAGAAYTMDHQVQYDYGNEEIVTEDTKRNILLGMANVYWALGMSGKREGKTEEEVKATLAELGMLIPDGNTILGEAFEAGYDYGLSKP